MFSSTFARSFLVSAICAGMLLASSACTKRSGGPTSPSVTPTKLTVTRVEFRIAPTGLGSPLGQPITGPVPVRTNLQLVMWVNVNTDRIVYSTLKVFRDGVLVETYNGRGGHALAGESSSSTEFAAMVPGIYTAIGEASDDLGLGSDSKQASAVDVVN